MQKEHRQKALGDSLFIHVAFEAPDADERGLRRVSVVVLNRGDQPVKHTLRDAVYGVQTSVVWAPPRSITHMYTRMQRMRLTSGFMRPVLMRTCIVLFG